MPPKDWRKARGFCRATNALRRPFVAAQVCRLFDNHELVLLKQLQFDRWSACHSLYLDLGQLFEAQTLTPGQIEQLRVTLAGSKLPKLRCLHIIGRSYAALTGSSVEGSLVSHFARAASLLTLQMGTLMIPLDFPNLQHLALELMEHADGQAHVEAFAAMNMLKGLKTLYVQSASPTTIDGPVDLTCCGRLQCVAVQGIKFCGMLRLPAGCLLHAKVGFDTLDVHHVPNVAHLVTGLTFLATSQGKYCRCMRWPFNDHYRTHGMWRLKRVRLILNKKDLHWPSGRSQQEMVFDPDKTPCLEVVEIHVESNLIVSIDPMMPLKSLALIAAGTLKLQTPNALELCPISMTTLKHM